MRRDGRIDPVTGEYIRYSIPAHNEYTCTGDLEVDEAVTAG